MPIGRVRVQIDSAEAKAVAASLVAPLVFDTTRAVLNRTRALTPVRTGTLRAGSAMVMKVSPTAVTGRVENRIKYFYPVHEGASPHVIRPRRRKLLKFQVGGRTVYARKVNHPGNKGNPFMTKALLSEATPRGFMVKLTGPGSVI